VIATSRAAGKISDLPNRHSAITPVELAVSDPSAIHAFRKEAKEIDVLANCAGWERSCTINVVMPARLIRAFLAGMIERRGGRIINVAFVRLESDRCAEPLGLRHHQVRDDLADNVRGARPHTRR
jgi:NADP-dependent 3-hydroxy acid dehydrogenase YdfG